METAIRPDCFIQSYYKVWSAESECRALQNQSAEHGRVIEQSQSSILEQEKKAERLFTERQKQQQVYFSSLSVANSAHMSMTSDGDYSVRLYYIS